MTGPPRAIGVFHPAPDDTGDDAIRTGLVLPIAGKRVHYGGRYPRRRNVLARWASEHRPTVVALTAIAAVLGYAVTVALFFERGMPTPRLAAALVAVALVLVGALLSVVLWSRRE